MRCLSSRGFGCPPQAAASAKLLPIRSYRIDLEADLPDSAHLHFYRRSLFRPRIARPYESHKDMSQAVASAKLLPILSYRIDLEADLPDSAPTLRAPLEAIRKGAAQKPLLFALTRILLCFEPHGACARQQGYAAGRAPSDIALTKNRKALKLLL